MGKKGIVMAAFQTVLSYLNQAFSRDNIQELATKRENFAPGRALAQGAVVKEGTRLHALWTEYLAKLPPSFQDTIRAIVYGALSTEPLDAHYLGLGLRPNYELTLWQSPDTPPTKGGIHDPDEEPLSQRPASSGWNGSFPAAK